MAHQIDTGDVIRLSAVFRNRDTNALVDPDTVILNIKLPDAVLVTYTYPGDAEIIKDSTGNYHCDYLLEQQGMYFYKWWGEGTIYAAEEKSFYVKISQI